MVEENFWGAERGARVSLVSPSLQSSLANLPGLVLGLGVVVACLVCCVVLLVFCFCFLFVWFGPGEFWSQSQPIPAVDRQCLALVRQCRKKMKTDRNPKGNLNQPPFFRDYVSFKKALGFSELDFRSFWLHPGKWMGGNGWKLIFLFNWVIFRFQLLILKSVLCLMKQVHESGLGSTQQYFSCILQSHSSPFLYFFVLFLYFPVFAQISKRKKTRVFTPVSSPTWLAGRSPCSIGNIPLHSWWVSRCQPCERDFEGKKNRFAKSFWFLTNMFQQGFFNHRHPQGFGVYMFKKMHCSFHQKLVGGFKYFLFPSLPGEIIQFD